MARQANVRRTRRWRAAAGVVVGLLVLTLLPATGLAQPEPVEEPNDACPDETNPPAPFTDRLQIPEVHRTNVDCAFNNDIALGFSDGSYRAGRIVQRDQFASFMVRTLQAADVDLPPATDQGFTDIAGNVHEDNINIIAETGITVGTSPTTYSPSLKLRRDQIASFVLRAVAFIEDVNLENLQRDSGPFTDVPASNVHARNINGARALNLTIGRTAGTYEPRTGTRRDQMASFLVRLLAALSGEGPLIPAEDRVETLALTPQTATNPVDTSHTLTATVRDDENVAVEEANVRFEVYRDAAGTGEFSGPVAEGTQDSDAAGQSGFTYDGPADPASDVVVACAVRPAETCEVVDTDDAVAGTQFTGEPEIDTRVSDVATKTWVEGPPIDRIEVAEGDLDAVNPLGETHTVTATAFDDGNAPAADAEVRFEVYRAPTATGTFSGPVEQATVTTDAAGVATFSYSHDQEAVDRIVICAPVEGSCQVTDVDPVTAGTQFVGDPVVGAEPNVVATKTWVEGPPIDRIEVAEGDLDAVNPLGETHTVTATAFDDGNAPAADAEVRFEVYRAPTATGTFSGPVEQATVTTDAAGVATFSYSHDQEAVDRIVICAPVEGSCQVTDEDAATAGTQFVGDPVVGAEPNVVATKTWVTPTFPADSLTASAFGLNVNLLGDDVVERLPRVAIALPPPDAEERTDSVLDVPLNPLADAAVLDVDARGTLAEGFAQGEAEAADVEVLLGELPGEALITADAIHVFSTSTCPDPGTLEEASAGSQFVNLTVGDVDVPLNPAPNTTLEIPGVATVVVNEVIPDAGGEGHGFTVRGLRVNLLDGTGEVIVAEAHSSVICGDPVVAP